MRTAILLAFLLSVSFPGDYQEHLFNCVERCCNESGGIVDYSDSGTPYCSNLTAQQGIAYNDCGERCSGQADAVHGALPSPSSR